MEKFVAPVKPEGDVPQPDPQPSDLAARVKVLEDRADVQGMQLQTQAATILMLKGRVEQLEATDPPPAFESIYVTARVGTKTYAGTLPVEG